MTCRSIAGLLLLATFNAMPAYGRTEAGQPPACWKVKAFVAWAGSVAEAERLAPKYGYTAAEILEAKRRCLVKDAY
jgi:hypothetical protein